MRQENGDLWTLPADARCITTNASIKKNGHAVMGRGNALEAAQRYAGLPAVVGALLEQHGSTVAVVEAIIEPWALVLFPVKYEWNERASLRLIEKSARELQLLVNEHPTWQRVLLPRPGCGNGQLNWTDVEPVIAPLLDDRIVVIDR